ncbi:hypothetical protein HOY80DRAFT_949187 [Tuber brumale]|nr:hypothetical protein HOY80DRAFT_949187 [Tuber brumale]
MVRITFFILQFYTTATCILQAASFPSLPRPRARWSKWLHRTSYWKGKALSRPCFGTVLQSTSVFPITGRGRVRL